MIVMAKTALNDFNKEACILPKDSTIDITLLKGTKVNDKRDKNNTGNGNRKQLTFPVK